MAGCSCATAACIANRKTEAMKIARTALLANDLQDGFELLTDAGRTGQFVRNIRHGTRDRRIRQREGVRYRGDVRETGAGQRSEERQVEQLALHTVFVDVDGAEIAEVEIADLRLRMTNECLCEAETRVLRVVRFRRV